MGEVGGFGKSAIYWQAGKVDDSVIGWQVGEHGGLGKVGGQAIQ